jgi:Mrp family chromosome partitioning ATPase
MESCFFVESSESNIPDSSKNVFALGSTLIYSRLRLNPLSQATERMKNTTTQLSFEEKRKLAAGRLSEVKNRIIVLSGKGGVGKSTVAVNLAAAIQQKGYSTGLIDADLHGPSVPKMLGLEDVQLSGAKEGIKPAEVQVGSGNALRVISLAFFLEKDVPVIWRSPLKVAAIQQFLYDVEWGKLDYLIFDLPPGTGDEPLSISQIIGKVTGAIIVTTPQDVALIDSRRAVEFAKRLKIPVLGVIENMSTLTCPHCKKEIELFKRGGGEVAAKELGVPFLGRIPIDPTVVSDSDSGTPFVLAHSRSDAAKAFKPIVDKIRDATKNGK